MSFESKIKPEDLQTLNGKVYEKGSIDREHLIEFLTIIPTSDGRHIVEEVHAWLTSLHLDPKYDKIVFPNDDINAVISDLDSYGKVSTKTILEFKQSHSKTLAVS